MKKFGSSVAVLTALTVFAGAGQAAAQSAEGFCSTGVPSASPQAAAYDIVYRVAGSTGGDLQPRNGGFAAMTICNLSRSSQATYFLRYMKEDGSGTTDVTSTIEPQSCDVLRGVKNLGVRSPATQDVCVWARYRD